MQIQLKQHEIVAALKQYISSQGIRLQGREVDIRFTAGRGSTGLTADIQIEDTEGLDIDESLLEDEAKAQPPKGPVLRAVDNPEKEVGATEDQPKVEEPSKATTSLFG